jgi:hypothetical protein
VNRLFGAESTDRTNQQHMVQRWIRRDIDPFCESTNNKAILAGLPSTIDWLYPWIHQEIYLYLCESTPSTQHTKLQHTSTQHITPQHTSTPY